MKVSLILKNKGSTEVATIRPESAVSEAVSVLSQRRIGAIVVTDASDRLVGILSEKDIVSHLGQRGDSVLDDPVSALR